MCFYRSPTKLREDNVISCVFLSFCQGGGPHVTITHDALDLNVQPIPPPPEPQPCFFMCYWHLVAKTGYLFKLVHLRTSLYSHLGWCWNLVAGYLWWDSGCYAPYWNAFLLKIVFLSELQILHYHPQSWGKIIFSEASVILFKGILHPGGSGYRGRVCLQGVEQTPPNQKSGR